MNMYKALRRYGKKPRIRDYLLGGETSECSSGD